jgi:hypothetical protein
MSYFTTETITDEDKNIAAEGGLFALHTIKHNHSFRSVDCTSSVIRNLHVQTFSCGRTKCEAIVVLAPFAMLQILEELETAEHISVTVDTSNYKSLKLVRYFIPSKGVQDKVTELHNLKGETADVVTTYITDVLDKYKLSNKIIAFCGDNCNTNFGGAARKGTNNVFAKLTTSGLKMNIRGIERAARILHNALRTSADIYQLTLRP